jgi:hypothetical protein
MEQVSPIKLALIPPISWLATSTVTNYQLMLPHLLTDQRYADHYRALAKRSDQYVIMDNGEAEGKNHFLAAQLVGMGIYCQVNEVVVPDVIQNQTETLNRMGDFFKSVLGDMLRNDAFNGDDVHKLKFMGVAQGTTYQEVYDCIQMMMELHGDKLHTIALPRHLLETVHDNTIRLSLAEDIHEDYCIDGKSKVRIHCLGASPVWPREMLELAKQGIVDGMDTSMPYNWAYNDRYLNDQIALASTHEVKRPPRYFSRPARNFNQDALHYNIGLCRRWANGDDRVSR